MWRCCNNLVTIYFLRFASLSVYDFKSQLTQFSQHGPCIFFFPQVGDIESDAPSTKRLRRSSSDALQDLVTGEELSFFGTGSNNAQTAQVKSLHAFYAELHFAKFMMIISIK